MRIVIETIPHKSHRYSTCGDYFMDAEGTLQIRVSEEMPETSQGLVILHELAEMLMCRANGVSIKSIDDFDMNFEANRKPGDLSEPGDQPDAPYRDQHNIASGIERIVCAQMGVGFLEHEKAVDALFQ